MSRGIDRAAGAPGADDLRAEGEGYAWALLDRIGTGTSCPEDLAAVMQLMHSGPMLHGACAVLFLALRLALGNRPQGAAAPAVQTPAPGGRCDAR